ncbi:MAG: response regulator [Candidatus Omnitrophica bacterium]|nr:response regulator [Candidatus Omnitrophota bacterium]
MNDDNQLKILIVDDDEEDYMIIRELFSEIVGKKYRLDWAAGYEAALEIIERNDHDVYLFDYRLGDHTGLGLLRAAIDNGCKAPIILLTGQGDHEIDLLAMKMGAADYLVKGEMDAAFLDRSVRYALEHKNMENELRVMLRDLQRAHEALKKAVSTAKVKSDFLANMSHEIRTPMNAILGFSELLRRTPLDGKQKNYSETVSSSGKLLIGIIDDILDISKLESGNIMLESSGFNLEDLILDVFKMIVTRMKDKPFDTYVDIAEDVPREVFGDEIRLKQVLVNLLGNAVKFTSQGDIGVIVELEDKVGDEPDNIYLRFTVKDTGIGIPEDKHELIFETFSQADETTTRRFGGTGLGLAISKAIVEMMGGRIRVESEEGKGSKFIFTIAIKKKTAFDRKEQDQDIPGQLKGKKVFIIDDNQIARKIVNKCCIGMGLDVVGIADSPQSALHKIENTITKKNLIPDLVLCDLIMEGMDGFELVKHIKENEEFKDVKYIAVTADIRAETSDKAAEGTFDAYITKPVSLMNMMRVIKKVMNVGGDQREAEVALENCAGIKILVADDSSPNQILMQAYFEELQCEGDFVSNGQEAIDKLNSEADKYDLCLMDLQMPVLGGVEATQIIRQKIDRDIPIIALTAAVLEEDRKKAEDAGMNDFMTKPINFVEMAEKIVRYRKKRF